MTHRKVSAGCPGDPYPPPPPSPARAHPMGIPPAWLMARAFAFPRQLGEKQKCFSPFPSEIFIYRDFKYLSKVGGCGGDVGTRLPGPALGSAALLSPLLALWQAPALYLFP